MIRSRCSPEFIQEEAPKDREPVLTPLAPSYRSRAPLPKPDQPARHVPCFGRNCTILRYFSSSNNGKKTSPGFRWWDSLGSSLSHVGVAVGGDLRWQLNRGIGDAVWCVWVFARQMSFQEFSKREFPGPDPHQSRTKIRAWEAELVLWKAGGSVGRAILRHRTDSFE